MIKYNLKTLRKGFFRRRTVYQIIMRHAVRTDKNRHREITFFSNTVVFESSSLTEAKNVLKDLREPLR